MDWSDPSAFERQSALYPNNRSHQVKISSIKSTVELVDPAPGMPDRRQADGALVRQESPADQCDIWIEVEATGQAGRVDDWVQRVLEINRGDDNVLRGREAQTRGVR